MVFLSDPGKWKIPILVVFGALFLTRRSRGVIGLLTLVLTLAISDQLSAKVLKPIFHRERPSVALADTQPLFGVRRSYAFPSVHATNFTAAVPVVATVFPSALIPVATVAALVSVSRIYVGDHWPSDVLGGAVLGLLIGLLGRVALLRLDEGWRRYRSRARPSPNVGAPSGGP